MFVAMTPEEQEREIARLDWEYHKQEVADRLRIQEGLGQTVLRGLTLVNGGAMIALFTLLGNGAVRFDVGLLWVAFGAFVVGLVATIGANALAYLMQVQYTTAAANEMWNAAEKSLGAEPRHNPSAAFGRGQRFETAMVAAALAGLAAFCIGAGVALAAVAG